MVSLEEAGFDSVWVPDHIEKVMNARVFPFLDSIALLGAIAEATTEMTIGASVHNASLRHPFRLAHAALTLDELSGGRVVLGVGAGARGYENAFLGGATEPEFGRFRESVEILTRLFRGEEVDHDGKYWRLEGARLPGVEDRSVPLMVGASGPKSIDLAFRWGDEWNTFELNNPRPENLRERVEIADRAETRYKRKMKRSIDVMVAFEGSPRDDTVPLLPAVTGSPQQVAESLTALADIGFDEVHCYGVAPVNKAENRGLQL